MDNKEEDFSGIIFGYMATPSFGRYGHGDGGFSIDIYPDGRLIYKTYIFSDIEKIRKELKIAEDAVADICAVLDKHKQDIDGLEKYINNGSFDLGIESFIFNGKKIITQNITYTIEDELRRKNPYYVEEYLSAIRQENLILIIFAKISRILKTQGIDMRIVGVYFCEDL